LPNWGEMAQPVAGLLSTALVTSKEAWLKVALALTRATGTGFLPSPSAVKLAFNS